MIIMQINPINVCYSQMRFSLENAMRNGQKYNKSKAYGPDISFIFPILQLFIDS